MLELICESLLRFDVSAIVAYVLAVGPKCESVVVSEFETLFKSDAPNTEPHASALIW